MRGPSDEAVEQRLAQVLGDAGTGVRATRTASAAALPIRSVAQTAMPMINAIKAHASMRKNADRPWLGLGSAGASRCGSHTMRT